VSQAGSFYFTNDIRVHEGSFLKEEKTEDLLALQFVKGKAYDQLIFRKRENSSFARDRLDALKLFSYDSQMPQLYSYSEDGRNLCVNTVPELYTPHGLDIALYVPAHGTYSIKLAEASGVFADQPAWLEDLKEGTWHELSKDGEHSFSATTSDDPLRFKLHFSAQDIDEEQIIRRTFHLWTVQDVLYINNPSLHKGSIEVFGLAGQRLGSYKLSGNEQQSISMPAVFGVYLVQINWAEGSESHKVFGR